jgi:Fe-S cluster assembly protein SufD
MSEVVNLQDKLVGEFARVEGTLNGQAKTPVHAIRQQAMKRFAELGFPTVRHEEWKYTNIMPVVKNDYALAPQSATTLTKADIEPFLLPNVKANVLVFVNGAYAANLSTIISTKNVEIMPLAEAFTKKTAVVEHHFAQVAAWQNDAMLALNTAFALNGAYIEIAKGSVVEEPFHLLFVNDSREQSTFAPARNLIVVGANAEATIVESAHTLATGENVGFTNVVSEVILADNARLHHYKIQNDVEQSYFIGALHAHQETTSVLNTVVITLSGGIVRNNLSAVLAGKGADTHFYGLYLVNGKTLVDNHTLADHAVAHCTSNELYKGIMDDRSTGVFNGKIMVRADAQKTLAYQSNRNILMSPNATVNTKPQLEIFADDVKCSHGCTAGQLDDESVFYLRARGLDKEQAQALLLYAFAGEITEKIALEPLRERLETIIAERLHQELV